MNPSDELKRTEVDVIADAVRTYPLAPAPPGLIPAILSRVQQAGPRPRWRWMWIDVALTLWGATMAGLGWLLPQLLANGQPQNWPTFADAMLASALAGVDSVDIALGALGILGGLMSLGLCLILALVLFLPRPIVRLQVVTR